MTLQLFLVSMCSTHRRTCLFTAKDARIAHRLRSALECQRLKCHPRTKNNTECEINAKRKQMKRLDAWHLGVGGGSGFEHGSVGKNADKNTCYSYCDRYARSSRYAKQRHMNTVFYGRDFVHPTIVKAHVRGHGSQRNSHNRNLAQL